MKNPLTVFRSLIVVSLVLSLTGAFIDILAPGLVPPVLTEAYETYTEAEMSLTAIAIVGLVSIALLVVAAISTVGLLVLQPWARPLALWSTVISVATYPFLGAIVYSGIALLLLNASLLMWGAALGMTYFSELRRYFERSTP